MSALRSDLRFRRLADHLHRLGPRPVGEFLIEAAAAHGVEVELLDRLERMAALDPEIVSRLEARDWPPLPIYGAAA